MADKQKHIAYFITPHGYGHAARASAVMNAIHKRRPDVVFEIFGRTPVWFFKMSLDGNFNYHEAQTDLGMVQTSAMAEDLGETIQRLGHFIPFRTGTVQSLAQQVLEAGCEQVICDVAPLGIAVAQKAGLHAMLVENFTWDWIYEGYLNEEPRFQPYIDYLKKMFASPDLHIRTEPACSDELPADLLTNPVWREPRHSRAETRQQLGAPADAPVVMISMGGILTQYPFLDRLVQSKEVLFLIPGGSETYERRGSLILVPHHSNIYHPDMMQAADVIIGKLGYSTLAEAYSAGIPFAYVPRARFRESPVMAVYAREVMDAVEVEEGRFFSGEWLDLLPELLARPKNPPTGPNGAAQIAEYLD